MNLTDHIDRACELVYRNLTGKVPCDKWKQVSYGRAGGTVLQKDCDHETDKCYPSISIGSIHGEIGKPYKKLAISLDAWRPLWEKMGEQGLLHVIELFDIVDPTSRRNEHGMYELLTGELYLLMLAQPIHHLEAALRAIEVKCDRCGGRKEIEHPINWLENKSCTCNNGKITLWDKLAEGGEECGIR